MNIPHLLEAAMLVCFGFSWPLNVVKAYRSNTAKGTSLAFITLIITGYVAGIMAKIINRQINYVLAVYFLNLLIVSLNVAVYIRNKSLDRKRNENSASFSGSEKILQFKKSRLEELLMQDEKEDEMGVNYSNSLDEVINPAQKTLAEEKNSVILLGGSLDLKIPVAALSREFSFNFEIYNKSQAEISLLDAKKIFLEKIRALEPEGIILHLGENDRALFKNRASDFDGLYISLIEDIRRENGKCRIAVVSLLNTKKEKTVSEMNRHIRAVAEAERCTFVNLEDARLWNPEATRAAVDFAYSTGLRTRKPLRNVAEILYGYAYKNLVLENSEKNLVG